jgi:hypothetical protein
MIVGFGRDSGCTCRDEIEKRGESQSKQWHPDLRGVILLPTNVCFAANDNDWIRKQEA